MHPAQCVGVALALLAGGLTGVQSPRAQPGFVSGFGVWGVWVFGVWVSEGLVLWGLGFGGFGRLGCRHRVFGRGVWEQPSGLGVERWG